MTRAFLIVLDSVGIGGARDAADFGDAGSDTLGHIAEACAAGRADQGRSGPLHMPNLDLLGLGAAARLASGAGMEGFGAQPRGLWGAAEELSRGKDTPSGHWELAGVPVPWEWHYFPETQPAFPPELTARICRLAGTGGIHGNRHAPGTAVIDQDGPAHMQDGWPICYTSADSVLQIAAHEERFGLQRLLDLCAALAPDLHAMRVGRVIARPFVGSAGTGFTRTPNRRDFAIAPPSPTLLDWARDAGRATIAIGKIGDIFSGRGIDRVLKGADDAALFDHLVQQVGDAPEGSLTFANFVEFDSLWGHRRDVAGYARALERFDARVPDVLAAARPGDLILFTADHGNDPTWRGTDHTRERVPVVASGLGVRQIGLRGFADVAASVADHLGIASQGPGRTFL
ncbi:phosphopentomutase [Brevirhabdus sp.]|uniref:phosphopentomutase n=1 Tax=Brevirhabdus sp. TaxID=2004514 RepID=UPI004059B94E